MTAGDGVGAVRPLAGGQPPARARDRARLDERHQSMVATLALQEVQRGRWRLCTTVEDVLARSAARPRRHHARPAAQHRSGAQDYLAALLATATSTDAFLEVVERQDTDRQLVAAALTLPWTSAPGTSFNYSNTNYVVVGMMLARSARRPVRALLERRIFGPARMSDSSFPVTPRFRGFHLTEYAYFPARSR